MGLLNRFRHWRRWKATLTAGSINDLPDRIPCRRTVLVGTRHPKWIVFDCPCDRGHRVMLNLDAGHYPRWRLASAVPMTLQPSVDERSNVGHCHYVVRDGRVRWIERTDHR